ncbi:family 43 glycosylhydrolase [Aequorivita todarodis]|uniref:family 43 glycosylhydrolase n=1 Tax=Aequorivita todarodis TaxID=2036821 RepID=UPI00235102E0|nr:family 43 glycosylhydrolase [Aequorivita todarodis]MDC8001499.1 family 43 glycosylhydrolase [Aequorivita todarodis]
MKHIRYLGLLLAILTFQSCKKNDSPLVEPEAEIWVREETPVLRDPIPNENYQSASDAHVFLDNNNLRMIYSGDHNGKSAIKLANGSVLNQWLPAATLLGEEGPSGMDGNKETAFYRKASNGKHQIYYIGYPDEETYEAQIFLAEADALTGPYSQMDHPVVPKGTIAGKNVYCITSPSIVEHQGKLFLMFLGWNNAPSLVTEIWLMGATSTDDGHTWTDFRLVDTPIGMEGQVTKIGENSFVAVRTGTIGNKEAIFYATASHPFGPWTELPDPLIVQAGPPYEKDEIIAPSIFVDPATQEEILYYTGADYSVGWWIMMARKE